ncbi:MAG: pyridoxal phosphate-dependent aminotransferase, partial [Solobacterium sp.]|nr:pyridoxal phosphate-dependent aminotransferase [Solobacterium sp.]
WVIQNQIDALAHSVIATPGGTGAVSSAFTTFLDEGETIILPDIAWGSYTLMASENNLNTAFYTLFEDDHFNLSSLKECIEKVMQKQDRILFVINDPCHNPTGYTMQRKEWEELIQYLNSLPKNKHFIILNDIAYIDYAYSEDKGRHYLSTFNSFDENILALIAFSTSKTLTSYGLRCGAAIILAKKKDDVRDVEIILEKKARATWSNIPNAAMENFTWIVQENREAFLKEKEKYVNLLKERSDLFIEEAKACDLDYYPYHEGFFITLKMKDNAYRDQLHEVLLRNHIYTVQVNKGIRLAICSLPIEKVKGLAKKIKELEGEIH